MLPMADRTDFVTRHLVLTAVLIVARQAIGPPIFRGEFVIEDFILLLTLAYGVVPLRFKSLIWRLTTSLVSTTMTLIAWTTGARELLLAVFASLAIYSLFRAIVELPQVRSRRIT